MIGATAKADQFRERSGSDATKGSRTGVNLLGWGCDETLTIEQQRDAVRLVVKNLQQRLIEIKAEFLGAASEQDIKRLRKERAKTVDRLTELMPEVVRLNGAVKSAGSKEDMASHIVKIFRERVTKHEWACIVAEAKRRFDAERAEGPEA